MLNIAENSNKTVGRPFEKGTSGNPGGRPRGLAAYVRESIGNEQEMVDLMTAIMREVAIDGTKPRIKDRMDATSWIADRAFGKPTTQIEATNRSMNVDITLSEMSSEKLIALLQSSGESAGK
jgi:hypothetical protein